MICSTPAFVLRAFDFRETSKIAVFFTRDFGKVKGVLKGIRKDPKKFSSSLAPLSLNHIVFYQTRTSEIHLVSQCDLVDDFGLYRGELHSFRSSHRVSEMVDFLMPLEDPHKEVFNLLVDFLNTLKSTPQATHTLFQIKILALSGFRPRFDSCVICESKIAQSAYFSSSKGGLLCPACLKRDPGAEPTLPGTIASILYVERSEWPKCLRLQFPQPIKKQLEDILNCFIHFHVGKRMKTAHPGLNVLDA